MLHFDSRGEPVAPRDAATLLVVRDGDEGLEIFCVRRHAASAFMGGAVVFPGGKLDAADHGVTNDGIHARAPAFADDEDQALALAVCACRESFEEAAILPLTAPLAAEAVEEMRRAHEAGEAFSALLAERDLVLATAALVPFARWVTPEAESRRFDARFFLTALPPGQRGLHDAKETTSGTWASPQKLLQAFASGEIFLAPPTLRSIELLSAAGQVQAAITLALEQSLAPIRPLFVASDPPMLVLPGDPAHPEPGRCVAGPTRFVLRDGKLVSEEPS